MALSFGFHIFGIIFWIAGLLMVTRLLRLRATSGDEIDRMTRSGWFGFALPGCAIALVTGFYQLLSMGIGYYMKQGWFHTKLTFVIVLFVVTAMTGFELRRTAEERSLKRIRILHGIVSGVVLVIILVTYLGRGG